MSTKLLGVALLTVGCASNTADADDLSSAPRPPAKERPPAPSADDTYYSVTAGFSMTKPSAWNFASAERVAENRAQVRLNDERLAEMMRNNANAPLVVAMKHQEPYPDLNPSAQVMIRPLGQLKDVPPTKVMELAMSQVQQAMADFTYVEPIQQTTVSGLPAARMVAQYTVETTEGVAFATTSRMWIVPRGAFMFMISMSGPQEGPDVCEADFERILASIKIDP